MRRLVLGVAMTAIVTAIHAVGPALAADPPLIPRQSLFGNPSRSQAQLSRDGRHLAWLAPRDGVMNLWVAPASDPASARALTSSKVRPIPTYVWAPDARTILFVQDKDGDENVLLYAVDVETGVERSLTPFDKTQVRIVEVSHTIRDRILIGLNNRDPRWHDIHSLDLATGKLDLVMKGDGFVSFVADDSLTLRIAVRMNEQGGAEYFRVADGKVEDKPFVSTGLEDGLSTGPSGYTVDGRTLYWTDSRGRDTAALVAEDVASGTRRIIAEHPRADIGATLSDPKTGVVQAWSANYLKREWTVIDPSIAGDLEFLKSRLEGEISVTSRTDADDRWIVSQSSSTLPGVAWFYDRAKRTLTKLYATRPELEGVPLQPMRPVEIKARDGLTLPSYLSLPAASEPGADGRPRRPVPMVLLVHGGPWARDSYSYNGYHQWLANRGYAVLAVNFRGSTGFGKAFLNAGNLQWGRKMHDDLIDAVDWAVAEGYALPDKIAIMGGSYGGYATLAGLTFTPSKFACGVDIVGPSNIETLLATIPPYWTSFRRQFLERMGDPSTAEGKALLQAASPLNSVDVSCVPCLSARARTIRA